MYGFRNRNIKVKQKNKLTQEVEEEVKVQEKPLANPDDPSDMGNYKITNETRNILKKQGIVKLFPIQYKTFNMIYNGVDLIGRDKTGSGKTLGYALPIIERFRAQKYFEKKLRARKPIIIIIVPTRELVMQVKKEYEKLQHTQNEFQVMNVYGGTDINAQISQLQFGADIIVGTPGRVIDLSKRQKLQYSNLRCFILDEADEMLNMGFADDIEEIFKHVAEQMEHQVQNLMFSATIPNWVHKMSERFMSEAPKFVDLLKGVQLKTPSTVTHLAMQCSFHSRLDVIKDVVLCYGGMHKKTIIFTDTKKDANRIFLDSNIKTTCQVLHGDIPQKQREITFEGYRKGQFMCLIATNVAARGIDIPETDLIIQLSPPKDVDTYIHRAGRTARAGRQGFCVTFYGQKDQDVLRKIESKTNCKFRYIGAPQKKEIVEAQARDIQESLKGIKPEVLDMFDEIAENMIKELGAKDALKRALAYMCKQDEALVQRSVLCGVEGFVTYIMFTDEELYDYGDVKYRLRKVFSDNIINSVKGTRICKGNQSAVFDAQEGYSSVMKSFISENDNRFFTLEVCEELPELIEIQSQGYGRKQYGNNRYGNNRRGGYQGGNRNNNRNDYGGGRNFNNNRRGGYGQQRNYGNRDNFGGQRGGRYNNQGGSFNNKFFSGRRNEDNESGAMKNRFINRKKSGEDQPQVQPKKVFPRKEENNSDQDDFDDNFEDTGNTRNIYQGQQGEFDQRRNRRPQKQDRGRRGGRNDNTHTLYMGNLDYNTDVNDIFDFFDDENLKPVDVNLKFDRETKKSKGFAFIKFGSKEDADKAIKLDGEGLGRRQVKLNYASNN